MFIEKQLKKQNCKWNENSGYKLCTNSNESYQLWVNKSEDCPLNVIYITTLSHPSQAPIGYKAQPLNGGNYVLYTNNSDRMPTVKFKFTRDIQCYGLQHGNKHVKLSNHPLNKQINVSDCILESKSRFNKQYVKIGSIREDGL